MVMVKVGLRTLFQHGNTQCRPYSSPYVALRPPSSHIRDKISPWLEFEWITALVSPYPTVIVPVGDSSGIAFSTLH